MTERRGGFAPYPGDAPVVDPAKTTEVLAKVDEILGEVQLEANIASQTPKSENNQASWEILCW